MLGCVAFITIPMTTPGAQESSTTAPSLIEEKTSLPENTIDMFAETGANIAGPVPGTTSLTDGPAMDFQSMQQKEYTDFISSPAWQADFLRNLAGNEGVLTLDSAVERLSGADGLPQGELQDLVMLDEAVAFALEKNFELKAAYEGYESAEWDKISAYSQFVPTVNLDLAAGNERSRPGAYNDENGTRVEDTMHHRKDRTLTIRQPLINLDIISDILIGEKKQYIADYARLETRDTITSDTIVAYLQILQSSMSMLLADQYKQYLDALGERMLKRVEGGGAATADLDRIVSRASIAENARVEASAQYETNILQFQRLTGIVPTRLQIPARLAPSIPGEYKTALERATRKNPSYLSSVEKIDAARLDRNKLFSGVVPKVYAQYMSGYTYNAGGAADGNPVDGVYPTSRTDSAMLIMQWNLNGGTQIASGMSGVHKTRQMQYQSIDVQKRLEQGMSTSYSAINATQERLNILQKTVEANERVVVAYEEQFKNGTRQLFDLLDAYEQLYNSRLNMLRAIFAYTQATYQIQRNMGSIVESVLETKDAAAPQTVADSSAAQ